MWFPSLGAALWQTHESPVLQHSMGEHWIKGSLKKRKKLTKENSCRHPKPTSLLVGKKKKGIKLTSNSDLQPLKRPKTGQIIFFEHFLGCCQIWGPNFFILLPLCTTNINVYFTFTQALRNFHSCLWDRSRTLLFAHNPSSSLPGQPLLVSINKPPRPINRSSLSNPFYSTSHIQFHIIWMLLMC